MQRFSVFDCIALLYKDTCYWAVDPGFHSVPLHRINSKLDFVSRQAVVGIRYMLPDEDSPLFGSRLNLYSSSVFRQDLCPSLLNNETYRHRYVISDR
jgi:hypothetical protein